MGHPLILLWGVAGDGPMASVRSDLEHHGVPYVFFDQQTRAATEFELSVENQVSGWLQLGSRRIDLNSITAAYLRPYDLRRIPAIQSAEDSHVALQHALCLEEAVSCWAEVTDAFVVNRPSAMASNNSKPYQSALIQSFGFAVPDTLVTTDPDAALTFWKKHGAVIYKSVSGVRSIVARLTERHLDRLDDVAHCPTQFQQYIAGSDFRIHVVGSETFGCEILSAADDYRYPDRQTAYVRVRAIDLSPDIASRCLALVRSLHLALAGIDLRQTAAGEWYCFEVNPSPGFTYYEAAASQPISAAVGKLLASAA